MARFPPGTGGGAGIARGGKGKGILRHRLTEGGGMPLANRTTPAHGDERAQVLPLLDAVKIRTGKRGRPRQRLHVIATDKGYDAKALREQLRKRGIPSPAPEARLADQETAWQAHHQGGPTVPSRAALGLVAEAIPSLGRPLGAHHRMLRGIPGSRHDSHLGP